MIDYVQIDARDGGTFHAYVSGEDGPAVVIAHEIFGVTHSMRAVADWLAAQGFVVAVPDLFWRQQSGLELDPSSESDRGTGMKLLQGLDEPKAVSDILATVGYLTARPGAGLPAGVVGYCMGGKLAYLTALEGPYPAVSYYGVGIEAVLDRAPDLKGPVLLHLPEGDALCPPDSQARIKAALRDNPLVQIRSQPDVGHAFARRDSPAFVAQAAEVADAQTIAFLRGAFAS